MRIISGTHRGRHIGVPRNFRSRPTTDFAKEALFNILANYFDFSTIRVLDLFSGTGSIGYEFASRNATKVDMVEINPVYSAFIIKTAELLNLKQIHVYQEDVFRFIPRLSEKYDIVFADPPYDLGHIPEIPGLVFDHNLLNSKGWFILEHGKDQDFTDHFSFSELRRYGSIHFSIFIQGISC